MKMTSLVRGATLALALAACGGAAFAEGDIYSRLMEMRQMDRDKDGMVSKEEFLAMAAKAWDMRAAEMKVKGPLSAEQLRELMKVLGRSVGAPAGG
ncbi:MAG: EF-hand domain-containing protein [Piscinibacter sp.]